MNNDSLIGLIEALPVQYSYSDANQPPYVKLSDVLSIIRTHTPAGREGDVERVAEAIKPMLNCSRYRKTSTQTLSEYRNSYALDVAEAALAAMSPVAGDAVTRALKAIVDFCDDPNGSETGESLACGMSRLLVPAREALAIVPKPVSGAHDELKRVKAVLEKCEPAESGWLAENYYQQPEGASDDGMRDLLKSKWETHDKSQEDIEKAIAIIDRMIGAGA